MAIAGVQAVNTSGLVRLFVCQSVFLLVCYSSGGFTPPNNSLKGSCLLSCDEEASANSSGSFVSVSLCLCSPSPPSCLLITSQFSSGISSSIHKLLARASGRGNPHGKVTSFLGVPGPATVCEWCHLRNCQFEQVCSPVLTSWRILGFSSF